MEMIEKLSLKYIKYIYQVLLHINVHVTLTKNEILYNVCE